MSNRLWVTWESHRRSKELALEFGSKYYPLVYDAVRPLRYIVLSGRTIILLVKEKPDMVFCQNPSIVLTSLLTLLKQVFRYKLIVDRHSNFKLEYRDLKSLKWMVFHLLSRWTVKNADLTIVTNEELKRLCESMGGRAEVLQDKLPDLSAEYLRMPPSFMKNMEKTQVMFVTMFDPDEPINEIIEAGKSLTDCVCYLTGNYRKRYSDSVAKKYSEHEVLFTGFIPDEDYLSLMENVDLVVVLTKKDLILNCGAYEAISMNKALILSDTPTLRGYFGSIAEYSKCSSNEIEVNVRKAVNSVFEMTYNMKSGKEKLKNLWLERFLSVKATVDTISRDR